MTGWRPWAWLLLALPALAWAVRLANGTTTAFDLIQPSGELSLRLLIVALLPGPLLAFFGARGWWGRLLRGWVAIRRSLGVAAFAYAVLHLAAYGVDMGALAAIVEELGLPGIWTGWLALAIMAVPAAISSDRAMRLTGRRWKPLQRLVYPALALALVHWALIDRAWLPAIVHLVPLAVAWSLRAAAQRGHHYRRSPA